MEMEIYVKIKDFLNRGSMAYGVWTLGFTMFTEGAMENINKIIISGTSNWNKIVFDMNNPIEQTNSLMYIGPAFK